MYKHAALSPAIQALEQTPTMEGQKQLFEQQLGEMAYQAFASKFPDLVESIVTFKMLDSNADMGSAFGAFILDVSGEPVYVPAVFADSAISPLEIMYVKSRDIFVPFTPEWVAEISRGADKALGEATKLPDTVPTDVDIRNLVVPPTTGRYSYAEARETAADVAQLSSAASMLGGTGSIAGSLLAEAADGGYSPRAQRYDRAAAVMMPAGLALMGTAALLNPDKYSPFRSREEVKVAAESSAPLARTVTKRANEQFDPAMWENFIEQFARMNGTTPGSALDQGQMGIDEISKLYKSHVKTWGAPQPQPQQPQGFPAGPAAAQPAAAAGMPPQGMYPKTAGLGEQAGKLIDTYGEKALESAVLGGLTGGLTGVYDEDYRDIGGRMMRGGVAGALGGTLGHGIGSHMNVKHPKLTRGLGDEAGQLIGAITGGLSARPVGLATTLGLNGPSYDPYGGQYRYASDLLAMAKHAKLESPKREPKLLGYLDRAPNRVKAAFARVLQERPSLLKFAAESYGVEPLVASLRLRAERPKIAGISTETFPGLRVAENREGTKSFGSRTPLAFRGVQLRGYYYEDPKPSANMAMVEQEYHDLHDMREPGVYKVWKLDGTQEPVLALVNPVDLLGDDRPFYPKQSEGVTRTKRYAPGTYAINPEPTSTVSLHGTEPDVERSHKAARLLVHGNGTYCECDTMFGEQVTENALEGTPVYKALFTDEKSGPKAGLGIFVYKTGSHYYGTRPVKLSKLSTSSDGVISATLADTDGYREKILRIDPRAPTARLMRPRGEDFVLVPATWRWVPLKGESDAKDLLTRASSVIEFGLNGLRSMGAHKVNVVNAGAEMASIDKKPEMPKAAALKYLADTHQISGADAEAILKIAEVEGRCRALIVPKLTKTASPLEAAFHDILGGLNSQMQQIQGQIQALQPVIQRAQELSQDPMAMQATDPAMAGAQPPQGGAPAPQGGVPGMDPSMQGGAPAPQQPPMPPQGMDPSMQGGAPAPQGAAPGMDPSMQGGAPAPQGGAPGMDPSMQGGAPAQPGMDPSMDPSMQQPQVPMMGAEGPSSTEIAQQINPAFLEQAAALQDQGVFDVSALTELDRAAGGVGGPNPGHLGRGARNKDLEETVDDLGRTLLTMQLRKADLTEQLSNDTYQGLEEQVRNTFQGLGKLMLELDQHTSALDHVDTENAA